MLQMSLLASGLVPAARYLLSNTTGLEATDCQAQRRVTGERCTHHIVYVALSDPGSMKCSYFLEQSPRDWEKTLRQNVVLTILHTQNICHRAWKTLRTTL